MKKLIMVAFLLLLILTWGCTKESGETWTGDLVVNGSFEQIEGNKITGWENVDTMNISHDVPEGGGNNSLILKAGDVSVLTDQKMVVPMTSDDYSFSCYVKADSHGGSGSALIEIEVHRGDSTYIAWEKENTGTFDWEKIAKDTMEVYKKVLY